MRGLSLCGLERFLPRLGTKRTKEAAEPAIPLASQKGKAPASNSSPSHAASTMPPGSKAPFTLNASSQPLPGAGTSMSEIHSSVPSRHNFPMPTQPGIHSSPEAGKNGWEKVRWDGPGLDCSVLARLDSKGNPEVFAHETFPTRKRGEDPASYKTLTTHLPADPELPESHFAISKDHTMHMTPGAPIYMAPAKDAASTFLLSATQGSAHYSPPNEPREARPMTHCQAEIAKVFDAEIGKWDPDGTKRKDREAGMVFGRTKDGDGPWNVRPIGELFEGKEKDHIGHSIEFPKKYLEQDDAFATVHSHPLRPKPSTYDQNIVRPFSTFSREKGVYDMIKKPDGEYIAYDGLFRPTPGTNRADLGHVDLIRPAEGEDASGRTTRPPSPAAF